MDNWSSHLCAFFNDLHSSGKYFHYIYIKTLTTKPHPLLFDICLCTVCNGINHMMAARANFSLQNGPS